MDWINLALKIIAASSLISAIIYFLIKQFAVPVIIETIRQGYREGLETLRHELNLAKSTYDQYLEKTLNYYANVYRHYRLCQNVVNADAIVYPDGTRKITKDEYLDNLEKMVNEYSKYEGYLRLLLPDRIRKIQDDMIDVFNKFRDEAKKPYSGSRQGLIECFQEIDNKKNELETRLREFLRTEKLLK